MYISTHTHTHAHTCTHTCTHAKHTHTRTQSQTTSDQTQDILPKIISCFELLKYHKIKRSKLLNYLTLTAQFLPYSLHNVQEERGPPSKTVNLIWQFHTHNASHLAVSYNPMLTGEEETGYGVGGKVLNSPHTSTKITHKPYTVSTLYGDLDFS